MAVPNRRRSSSYRRICSRPHHAASIKTFNIEIFISFAKDNSGLSQSPGAITAERLAKSFKSHLRKRWGRNSHQQGTPSHVTIHRKLNNRLAIISGSSCTSRRDAPFPNHSSLLAPPIDVISLGKYPGAIVFTLTSTPGLLKSVANCSVREMHAALLAL